MCQVESLHPNPIFIRKCDKLTVSNNRWSVGLGIKLRTSSVGILSLFVMYRAGYVVYSPKYTTPRTISLHLRYIMGSFQDAIRNWLNRGEYSDSDQIYLVREGSMNLSSAMLCCFAFHERMCEL